MEILLNFAETFRTAVLKKVVDDCFCLNHFITLVFFYTPKNIRKLLIFLMFLGGYRKNL